MFIENWGHVKLNVMSITKCVKVTRKNDVVSYEAVPIAEYPDEGMGEKLLAHSFLLDCFRKIMGRTLTIIDASIYDKQQNKAMKDLVRQIFSDEIEFSADLAYDQELVQGKISDKIDGCEYGESVTIEKALGVDE